MDDLAGKLNDLFSSPEGMNQIKNLMSMLSNSGSSPGDGQAHPPQQQNAANDMPFDPMLLMKIKSAMDIMNKGDPRVDLLVALKPNLSEEKQSKVDEAIRILRIINLMPLLREQGFL